MEFKTHSRGEAPPYGYEKVSSLSSESLYGTGGTTTARPYFLPSAGYEVPEGLREKPVLGLLAPLDTSYLDRSGSGDPLDLFLGRKREFLVKSVEEILSLIDNREKLKYENLRRIDYDSCKVRTSILQISSWEVGADPQLEKVRMGLEGEALGLEREKRAEEVACWRDTTRLKEGLREVVERLWQDRRREDLLSGSG